MNTNIFKFHVDLNWQLLELLSKIDRFDASWEHIKKQKPEDGLRQLKSVATVQSIGASTRIEGSSLSDKEIVTLLKDFSPDKLENRDAQEVAGYHEALSIVEELYDNIDISESSIKSLHNTLLKYSAKDSWHKGNYKKNNNIIEITHKDGSKQSIFKTTPCGIETERAMQDLINWYNTDREVAPLIKTAAFVYEILSIHPFQDGNGRLARLLTTLLLLKSGYNWIIYSSLEKQIEKEKNKYYTTLMFCQSNRPNENISSWLSFFLTIMYRIQKELSLEFTNTKNVDHGLPLKQKTIYNFLKHSPDKSSGEIAGELNMPKPTVVSILKDMCNKKLIIRKGTGKSTIYSIP